MLILSTLEVFLTWAAVAITLIGLGSLLLSRFANRFLLADAFWMGLAVSVAILEIWNLFFPLTASITLVLLAAGLLGLALNRSSLRSSLCVAWRSSPGLVLLGISFALLLSLRSCGPFEHYDTGLYGAQAVRWIQVLPAVPGLANLHGRLGFNSSVFLCIAALGQGPWKDLSFHLFTGFLLSALWATLLPACARIVREAAAPPADWFHGILAVPAFVWTARSRIVGTQTDEPAAIVALISAGILFGDLCQTSREDHPASQSTRLVLAATLLSLAVTFKISAAVFAFLAWCLVFGRIWQSQPTTAPRHRRLHLTAALLFPAVLLLPWLARSIILSGYPLFPATVFAFPISWKVPLAAARWYSLGVQSWGRNPDGHDLDTRGLVWLGAWLNRTVRNRAAFQVPLAISLAGLALALLRFRRSRPRLVCPWLALLLPALAGVLFWFAASPDPRFAQFAIWTTAATLGTWGIVSMDLQPRPPHARPAHTRMVLAALLLSLIWCLISLGWREPLQALRGVEQPSPLPHPAVTIRHTLSLLAVFVPAQGNQCWDAPLPCTPYFDPSLRFRDKSAPRGGFAAGFTAEGSAAELQTYW
jgi:hypothetical protein